MRTEQDVLKDFEALGYEIINRGSHSLFQQGFIVIYIYKPYREYYKEDILGHEPNRLTMQEHKLLNELFNIWGWLE